LVLIYAENRQFRRYFQ